MSSYHLRLSDSASFLMLAAAICVYVSSRTPHLPVQKYRVDATGMIRAPQMPATVASPATKPHLCVRRTRSGEPQATASDYGPCLLVHGLPTVPVRKSSVGMV